MLNLSQRLILGCVLLACLTGRAGGCHAPRPGRGGAVHAWLMPSLLPQSLVAIATIYFVLSPIRMLARDAQRIAQGNLEHRVEWSSRDDFGVIASELSRIAVGCASCATPKPAAGRWSFNSPTPCCNPSSSPSS